MLLTSDLGGSHFETRTASLENQHRARHADDFAEAFGSFLQAFTPEVSRTKEKNQAQINDNQSRNNALSSKDIKETKQYANRNTQTTGGKTGGSTDTSALKVAPFKQRVKGQKGEDCSKRSRSALAQTQSHKNGTTKNNQRQQEETAGKTSLEKPASPPHNASQQGTNADQARQQDSGAPPTSSASSESQHRDMATLFRVQNRTSELQAQALAANTHERQLFSDTQLAAMARALSSEVERPLAPLAEKPLGDESTAQRDAAERAWTEETCLLPNTMTTETVASAPTKASPRLLTQQITSALMSVKTADDGTKTQTIRLQLIPRTLGVITIQASFSEGKATIAFQGGEHALGLLERHAALLKDELTLQGWNLSDTPLSFGDDRPKAQDDPPNEGIPAVPVTHKPAHGGLFTRFRGVFT
jgi:hypothetical protein